MRYVAEYLSFIRGFSRNAKLFLWASALSSVGSGITFVVFNLYLLRVGLDESFLGLLVFYSSIAGTLFALPAGRASDYLGRRAALLGSGVLAAAGTLVQVIHPVPALLVPATFLTGAAWAVAMVTGSPLLVETSREEERAHLFGFQAALTTGASILGSNLGGLLPRLFETFPVAGADPAGALRATLLVGVVLMAVALAPLVPMREAARPKPEEEARPRLALLGLSDPRLVAKLIAPQALVGLGAGFIMPLQNVFMNRYLGATPAQIGLIFSAQSFLIGIGSLVAPFLAVRWGKVRAITVSQAVSLPFLAVMGLVRNLWVYGAASLVRATLMNLTNPLIGNFSMEVVPARERATVNSLLNMGWNLGWAVSGWAGGWLMRNVSYTMPYAFTFACYCLATALLYFFFRSYDPSLAELEAAAARRGSAGRRS